jgi:hypothetical protein
MRLKNVGTPIAIPAEGIGLIDADAEFSVDDALGERLLSLDRFELVEEPKAKPLASTPLSRPVAPSAAPTPEETGSPTTEE